jgi:hypothetical protein
MVSFFYTSWQLSRSRSAPSSGASPILRELLLRVEQAQCQIYPLALIALQEKLIFAVLGWVRARCRIYLESREYHMRKTSLLTSACVVHAESAELAYSQ